MWWVALAQVALIFDAATIHIHDSVLRACKAVGFWVVIVPPKTTSVLQPLDVDAFAMYKGCLSRALPRGSDEMREPAW